MSIQPPPAKAASAVTAHSQATDLTPAPGEMGIVWTLWLTYGAFYFCRTNLSAAVPGMKSSVEAGGLGLDPRAGRLDSGVAEDRLRRRPVAQRSTGRTIFAAVLAGDRHVRLGGAQCAVRLRHRFLLFAVRLGDERLLPVARLAADGAGHRQLGAGPAARQGDRHHRHRLSSDARPDVLRRRSIGRAARLARCAVRSGGDCWRRPACSCSSFCASARQPIAAPSAEGESPRCRPVAGGASVVARKLAAHAVESGFVVVRPVAGSAERLPLRLLRLGHFAPDERARHSASARRRCNYVVLAIGAVAGSYLAGWATDRFFGSRRAPVICILLVCLAGLHAAVRMGLASQRAGARSVCWSSSAFASMGRRCCWSARRRPTWPSAAPRRPPPASSTSSATWARRPATSSPATTRNPEHGGWQVAIYIWAGWAFAAAAIRRTVVEPHGQARGAFVGHAGVIVIAAGRGSRLMPTTADAPKCFAEVAGKRLLDWAVEPSAPTGSTASASSAATRSTRFAQRLSAVRVSPQRRLGEQQHPGVAVLRRRPDERAVHLLLLRHPVHAATSIADLAAVAGRHRAGRRHALGSTRYEQSHAASVRRRREGDGRPNGARHARPSRDRRGRRLRRIHRRREVLGRRARRDCASTIIAAAESSPASRGAKPRCSRRPT